MPSATRYTIFKTKWGYFGLAGTEEGILRSCLPMARWGDVKRRLLKDLREARFEKGVFKNLQGEISAYFEGVCVNFSRDIPIVLEGLSPFSKRVLTVCRGIRFGQTISYGRLAQKIGLANSARAVGNALAKNPLPLIIPCHRVICANGRIGGFSAMGGEMLKKRMLELEKVDVLHSQIGRK